MAILRHDFTALTGWHFQRSRPPQIVNENVLEARDEAVALVWTVHEMANTARSPGRYTRTGNIAETYDVADISS